MPRATVSQDTQRYDLKSCPGGFVELRRLPFGLLLERRDKASKMSMEGRSERVDISLAQQWSRQFEFSHCIVSHNLEDENGRALDFNNEMSLYALDPKIGQEIEKHLDEINREDDDEEKKDFPSPSQQSSASQTREDSTLTP